jgi:hypothetical protein
MKFHIASVLLVLTRLANSAYAFAPSRNTSFRYSSSLASTPEGDDKIAALRAAAAKARADADRLTKVRTSIAPFARPRSVFCCKQHERFSLTNFTHTPNFPNFLCALTGARQNNNRDSACASQKVSRRNKSPLAEHC